MHFTLQSGMNQLCKQKSRKNALENISTLALGNELPMWLIIIIFQTVCGPSNKEDGPEETHHYILQPGIKWTAISSASRLNQILIIHRFCNSRNKFLLSRTHDR